MIYVTIITIGGVILSRVSELVKNVSDITDAFDSPDYDQRDFRRGEVYYIDLEDTGYGTRYLQTKTRPGLIIQNDVGNQKGATLIVALMTTKSKKPYPFQYKVDLNSRESTILFEQLFTIDKFRVLDKLGELTYQQMKEADQALMHSLALNRLGLENVVNIDVTSRVIEKTKIATTIYFTINIHFTYTEKEVKISLDKLKIFDKTIDEEIDFDLLKSKLDCCRGLNWLVNNTNA